MKKVAAIILSLLLLAGAAVPVFATGALIPYSISVVFPDNQISSGKPYFDLMMVAGQKQELTLQLKNNTDKNIVLSAVPQNGATSSTGNIDYTGTGLLLEETMPYRFTDICSPAQEITLLPNEKTDVTFTLDMPDDPFDGILLGAFQVFEVLSETEENTVEQESGIGIQNRFAYLIGIVLRESVDVPPPNFYLGPIEPATWNSRFALAAELQLPVPTLVQQFEMDGQIVSRRTGKVIHTFRWESFSMAPNSTFHFFENLDPAMLPVGNYTMNLLVRGNGDEWNIQGEFAISPVKKYKTVSQTIEGKDFNLVLILCCVVFILLAVIIIYAVYRKLKGRRKILSK